jgi:DHA1 family multidrug resistance protein-like MFS transporter
MSEIPIFGRNIPYITTITMYLFFSLGAALVDNFGGLMFLRLLQGFVGSPCLANGAASLQDMVSIRTIILGKTDTIKYSFLYLPYSMGLWVVGMFTAPALGPVLSGFSVPVEGCVDIFNIYLHE